MTTNIILDSVVTPITVHTTLVEDIWNKLLNKIVPSNSTNDASNGPKSVIIVDLQRVERRFRITGFVDLADRTPIIDLFKTSGTFSFTYAGETLQGVMDKLQIKELPEDSDQTNTPDEEYAVEFTCVVGVDL